jgi:hypothetical protein
MRSPRRIKVVIFLFFTITFLKIIIFQEERALGIAFDGMGRGG